MFLPASALVLSFSFSVSLASVIEERQAADFFACDPPSTNTNACPSVLCDCSSYSYTTQYPVRAPTATGQVLGLDTVTYTYTEHGLYAASAGSCAFTAASQASSITAPCPSTTPSMMPSPPISSTASSTHTSVPVPITNCVTVSMVPFEPGDAYVPACKCLTHSGTAEVSDFTFGASWPADEKIHVLQPTESCYAGMDKQAPFARVSTFNGEFISVDCQGWPEDNSGYDQYRTNNPCNKAPYTTITTPTCSYVPASTTNFGGFRGVKPGYCSCDGSITSTGSTSPCPTLPPIPYTSTIGAQYLSGSCFSVTSNSKFCSCTASSVVDSTSTVTFAETTPSCTQGAFNPVLSVVI